MPKDKVVRLPVGHNWLEDNVGMAASEHGWICSKCGATFVHDMMDNSTHFEDGDTDCEEDDQEVE